MATTVHSSAGLVDIAVCVNGAPWSCWVNSRGLMIVPLGRDKPSLTFPTCRELKVSLEILTAGKMRSVLYGVRVGSFRKPGLPHPSP